MCGIAGIVYADAARAPDPGAIRAMCAALAHRGPDDSGQYEGPGVALGHTRLSILDLSPAGRQPLSNEDGTVQVTFNGEIYNFRELRRELEAAGHRFRSQTDGEVIAHGYEAWGDRVVERLDGMFAFALWDVRARRLLLARDRLGKKPLKFARIPGGLAFASELKALLAAGLVERCVDRAAIHDYLSLGYVPSPRTGFVGVEKLPPAHRAVFEAGSLTIERYWRLDYRDKRELEAEEWVDAVRNAARNAVRKRLISDVPLGAFLSGGIDSSIVVGLMAEASPRPVETFSIGFAHERYNELPHARAVAERHGTSHHEFEVRADEASLLPELARLYEEPYADASALPTYLLSRETRRHVTVALTGDGGDEGFSGYTRYARAERWQRAARWLGRSGIRGIAKRALPLARRYSGRVAGQLDTFLTLSLPELAERYAGLVPTFTDREKDRLLVPEFRAAHPVSSLEQIARLLDEPEAGDDPFDRMAFADVGSYLPDDLLAKLDLASMAHSLEARSPLLDIELLELSARIPGPLRVPRGAGGASLKHLLKRSFGDLLPDPLVDRPKQGFALPLADWFRGAWSELAHDVLLARDARIHTWLRRDAIAETLEAHADPRVRSGHRLWALVMLELWHREVVG